MIPDKAFILAAGFGKRLRPHTATLPKPLVEITGRSLLVRTLDHLEKAGIKEVMINTHYLADKITAQLQNRQSPRLYFSHEARLLDTGGGIKKALDFFKGQPFFVLSGDGLWTDHPAKPTLHHMMDHWDADKMDILILLQKTESMALTRGVGDYHLAADGRARRALDQKGAYMFTSMRINHPRIFERAPADAFSYLELLDQAEARGRLYGLAHGGAWHHISAPADLSAVRTAYRKEGL